MSFVSENQEEKKGNFAKRRKKNKDYYIFIPKM